MFERANVFAIHSWDNSEAYLRMEELLRECDPGLAHYSIPPERAVDGTAEDVSASIISRITFATAVVVLNSPGLHKRPWSSFEMRIAVEKGKRIVVVQPPAQFDRPIPGVLDGHFYRVAPWRADIVGQAVRGEYPQDGRVFDIAEVADRRDLVGFLASGVAVVSFVIVARVVGAFEALSRDLRARGIEVRWDGQDTTGVLGGALLGAAVGGILGSLSGDRKTALFVAGAGAAIGAAVVVHRVYKARLLGTADLRVLTVELV